MNRPVSLFTPELPFLCTVAGHHVYSNGRTFSIDEKLDGETLERIIEYMLNEGLINDHDDWVFLT